MAIFCQGDFAGMVNDLDVYALADPIRAVIGVGVNLRVAQRLWILTVQHDRKPL